MPPLPFDPGQLASDALDVLARKVELREHPGPTTHIALRPSDLADPAVPLALGSYVVAVIAGGVDLDCSLCRDFAGFEPDAVAELDRHLESLLGIDNTFDDQPAIDFRDRVRNPWIAEVLGHALLVVRARQDGACLAGDVVALTLPHLDPRRVGFDLLGIYEMGGLPVAAIGEVKASRNHGRRGLRDACTFFANIDRGDRSLEIRFALKTLKPALPPVVRSNLADGYWRERRTYLPLIVHQTSIRELRNHAGLGSLAPPQDDRRLIAMQINAFYEFFDSVADEARREIADRAS